MNYLSGHELVDMWLTVLLQETMKLGNTGLVMPSRLEGKRFIARIANDYCLLFDSADEQDNSKAVAWIRQKSLSRVDTRTIILDTGRENFGRLVFGLDSLADTDLAEAELRGIVNQA